MRALPCEAAWLLLQSPAGSTPSLDSHTVAVQPEPYRPSKRPHSDSAESYTAASTVSIDRMGDFLPADAASLWKSAPIFSTDYMEAELVSQRSSVERARAFQARNRPGMR